MNISENKLSISQYMGGKPINGADNWKIFLIATRKELAHRIFYTTCKLISLFYVKYYLIHTRNKISYIIRQLKINYPNKIKDHL